jgi:hypothetical protein
MQWLGRYYGTVLLLQNPLQGEREADLSMAEDRDLCVVQVGLVLVR